MRLRVARFTSAAMLLAGCAHTVPGVPAVNSTAVNAAQPEPALPAGDSGQVLVRPAQVDDFAGTRLQVDADRTRPVVGSSTAPACSALDSVGMAAFVGDGWSGFRVLLLTDGDRHNRVVAEAVTIYPDAETAAGAFRTGTKDVSACDGQRALGTGGDAAWRFSVSERNTDTVRWTKQQLAVPLTWLCQGEARLRNNAVVQAMACGADGGRILATTLADRMSARVWELSSR